MISALQLCYDADTKQAHKVFLGHDGSTALACKRRVELGGAAINLRARRAWLFFPRALWGLQCCSAVSVPALLRLIFEDDSVLAMALRHSPPPPPRPPLPEGDERGVIERGLGSIFIFEYLCFFCFFHSTRYTEYK